MDQERKFRRRSFISELVPDWRPAREQVLWAVRSVIVVVVVLGLLTLIGLPFGITLWAWVKLLIVPAVIAAGAIWFNRQQRTREMEIAGLSVPGRGAAGVPRSDVATAARQGQVAAPG